MKGSIQSLPARGNPGSIRGEDNWEYAFFITDFSRSDVEHGLEEFASVEFEFDNVEKSRARNCVLIRTTRENAAALPDSAAPASEQTAASITDHPPETEIIPRYTVPSMPLACRGILPVEWEVILQSNWLLRGSSKTSPEEAKNLLIQRARTLKANAILDVEYSTSATPEQSGSTQEESSGHHFQGRLAIIARKDPLGTLLRESLPVDIDREAELELSRLTLRRSAAQLTNYCLYGICLAVAVTAGMVLGYIALIVVGALAAYIALKLQKETRIDSFLTFSPVQASEAAMPADAKEVPNMPQTK